MTSAPKPNEEGPVAEQATAPSDEETASLDDQASRPSDDQASPSADPSASATANEVSEDLDALLADVTRERDEYLGLAQRAKADFENYRKRAARDSADAERRGKAALVRDLLPSLDNLERALAASGESSELARGVELVQGELLAALARAGVEAYDPTGERFDPNAHDAVATRPGGEDAEAGTVLETLERGYRFDGQLLRPARVVVTE